MKHHIRILTITALLLISTVSSIAQNKPSNLKLPKGVIARLGNGEIYDIHYSPDGKQLAIGSSVGTWIYDTATWQPIHLLTKNDIASTHFAYHPTENTLATFDSDYTINLWNTDEGIRIRQLVPSNRINSIVFSANGDTIAIAKDDFRIRLLDTKTGREKLVIQRPCGDESDIRCIAFKPNGFILAAGERTGKIALWDSLTGEHILDLDANKEVRTVTYNNDGTILATGSASDNVVRLWDTNTNEQIQTLKPEGKIYGVNRIVFSADGGLLAAACLNGTIQLWDMNTFQHMKTLKHIGLSAVSFSPDLRSLASYSNYDGSVRI